MKKLLFVLTLFSFSVLSAQDNKGTSSGPPPVPKPADKYEGWFGPVEKPYAYVLKGDSTWKIVNGDSTVKHLLGIINVQSQQLGRAESIISLLESQLSAEKNLTTAIREDGQVGVPAAEWNAKVKAYFQYLRDRQRR